MTGPTSRPYRRHSNFGNLPMTDELVLHGSREVFEAFVTVCRRLNAKNTGASLYEEARLEATKSRILYTPERGLELIVL